MSAKRASRRGNAVTQRVSAILARRLDLVPSSVSPSSRLVEDLGMDSVEAAEILLDIEDDLGIEFGPGAVVELAEVKTVKDLAAIAAGRVAVKSAQPLA